MEFNALLRAGKPDETKAESDKSEKAETPRAVSAFPLSRFPLSSLASSFSEIVGDTTILPLIQYVITLDTDTQLPREAARQLVGTMAHPLNRPVFDDARGIVREGYRSEEHTS